jgi:hypothetical protein
VGGQKSIQVSWPALSLLKTTQSERDTTRHNPTLPSRRTSSELDGLLPPYNAISMSEGRIGVGAQDDVKLMAKDEILESEVTTRPQAGEESAEK